MKSFNSFILLFLSVTTNVFSCDCCALQSSRCLEIGAEFLYFLPSIDQPEYAQEADPNDPRAVLFDGDRVSNSPQWRPGYRVDLAYFFCNATHLRGRFTHLPNIHYSDSTDERVSGILNHPGILVSNSAGASISDRFDFLNAELLFGVNQFCFCFTELDFELGVQYAYIKWKEKVIYNTPRREVIADYKFNGIGPELVANFKYHFFNCLSLAGRSAFAFLINNRDTAFQDTNINVNPPSLLAKSKNENYWYGTPTINLRFGLNYLSSCFCNFKINIEIGYEFIHFWKAVDRIFYTNAAQLGTSLTEHQDFTLHGPYADLGLFF